MKYFIAGLVACAFVAPAYAADGSATIAASAPIAAASAAVIEPAAAPNILRSGTEIALITREELTTEKKKVRVGQRVQLEVAANVEQNGMVVIPAGAPVVGEVTDVRNKGMWGKSGYINVRVLSLRLGDRTVRLSGTFDDKGVTGTAGVIAAVAFVPVVGFFTTGTSARIPSGSDAKGFLDEDIAFRAHSAQPVVLEVAAGPASGAK